MELTVYTLLVILGLLVQTTAGHKKYDFDKEYKMEQAAPEVNYKCIAVEAKCINSQSFILEAITSYNLAYISRFEVNKACRTLRKGRICIKGSGCEEELQGKMDLLSWVCKNKRDLFMGKRCWRSNAFMTEAPECDLKIQKGCHFHKLVGTCLKTVIGKNKFCKPKQMHFYGGMLEAIDKLRNPHGRC
ncbi:hypothetical protein LOTGIDRAFT_228455 [Lottia gigantea]|uniref:Uncharacterized protein n=1 Tax=Lottia gigantea TaxID=225164 RepID=V4AWP4_LOTGI|nr:hypothetical protein LOTGIDRAFT_228455 [Lottia gigantea]ESO97951.1 hypothetical protein LOTGIDRAFT_228455 [Lottia gigantea]